MNRNELKNQVESRFQELEDFVNDRPEVPADVKRIINAVKFNVLEHIIFSNLRTEPRETQKPLHPLAAKVADLADFASWLESSGGAKHKQMIFSILQDSASELCDALEKREAIEAGRAAA